MSRYRVIQGDKTQVLSCKYCSSENIQLKNAKIAKGVGADFRELDIICGTCGKGSRYRWTTEVYILREV